MLPANKGEGIEVLATFTPSKPLTAKKGYFFIDKELPLGGFEVYENHKIWIEDGTKIQKSLPFKEAGKYLITYANEQKKVLARDTVTIHAVNGVLFSEDVKNRRTPIGVSRKFYPSETGLYRYYICVRSAYPLDTHQLITEIYQYKVGDYRKPISTATDYVNHEWKTVFFLGPMLKPGQYRLTVKKANGELFATGYFELMPPKKE